MDGHVESSSKTFRNSDNMTKESQKVDESADSVTPVKAFFHPFEFSDSCKACYPFMKIDEVFGEWTCRICLYQVFGEKRIMKHISENHEEPLHTCEESKEFSQNNTDLNDNETEVEPMETDQGAIDPTHDQDIRIKRKQMRKRITFPDRQQSLPSQHQKSYNNIQGRNRRMNRWKPKWRRGKGRYQYEKPKISKEELDAQLDSYMANRSTAFPREEIQKLINDYRKMPVKFKNDIAAPNQRGRPNQI